MDYPTWLSIETYKLMMESTPICTVDVLLFNKDKTKTLLGKRTNKPYFGEYISFGGRMRKNESFENEALRILKAETGLNLDKDRLLLGGVINEINPDSIFDNTNYHSVNICFATIIENDELVLDSQHGESKWIYLNDPALHPLVKGKLDLFKGKIESII